MTYSKAKVKSSGDKAVLIIYHSNRKYIRQMLPYPKLTIGFMKHMFINITTFMGETSHKTSLISEP